MKSYDAVVIGAGPNGLAAAVTLARAGRSVLVLEAADTVGGGTRTADLTLPGYHHDVCSAVHPLGLVSPFFEALPLQEHGLRWLQPEVPVAHPLDGGTAVAAFRSVDETAEQLGPDGAAYRRLVGHTAETWDRLRDSILGPILRLPRHPLSLARFGSAGIWPVAWMARRCFKTPAGRAILGGAGAHSILPLDKPFTTSFALLLLALAHKVGWPIPEGGSQAIADALGSYLNSLGGEIQTKRPVTALADLPPSRAVLFDTSPRAMAEIAADRLPASYRRRLARFRHGPGVFKLDYALRAPVPWSAEVCRRAGTVHVGGTLDETILSEQRMSRGEAVTRPFVIVAQPSLIDATRAPAGRHTLWAYCHVPARSERDMTAVIESQIERFAPGFGNQIEARHVYGPAAIEAYNPNYVGGDIAGGAHSGVQLLFRPTRSLRFYRTPAEDIFLCSASTPPGAGVHGMCGYLAAQAALRTTLSH